eukprot:CAMPEP_0177771658 /NCGR_PEP_ID=MMETSP0491_2-20121128/11734_1 /TAXON_ID=63592 /ORGANISM="Tetraselmis chuii, Strain PLY429" /LENGTH=134 /DNA_ID=CAMNT_0019289271 /DNA_START=247 /DNA_END=651 /DNA_ORIENTATION=-
MEAWDNLVAATGATTDQLLFGLGVILVSLIILLVRSKGSEEAAAGDGAEETKTFTRAEVAAHSKEDDLWIILKTREHNKHRVYDVTAYVEEHPGGLSIMNNAGSDSTAGFYGSQHPPRVFDLIDEFYIGDLADP